MPASASVGGISSGFSTTRPVRLACGGLRLADRLGLLLRDLALALLAFSPAPPRAILEDFSYFFGRPARCEGPCASGGGWCFMRARVARIRSPRRGGHRGGGLRGHVGLLDRQLGAASRPRTLHVARLRRVPSARTWTQSASAVGQAAQVVRQGWRRRSPSLPPSPSPP